MVKYRGKIKRPDVVGVYPFVFGDFGLWRQLTSVFGDDVDVSPELELLSFVSGSNGEVRAYELEVYRVNLDTLLLAKFALEALDWRLRALDFAARLDEDVLTM